MCRAVSAAVAAALIAGCSSGPDLGPRFDDEGAAAVTCMKHQPEAPGPRYADPAVRSTADALAVLRYYTAHAGKGCCDGAGPTARGPARTSTWASTAPSTRHCSTDRSRASAEPPSPARHVRAARCSAGVAAGVVDRAPTGGYR